MTETQKKALALVNEVAVERGIAAIYLDRDLFPIHEALFRTIEELEAEKAARAAEREQHEDFRREVSDALEEEWGADYCLEHRRFARFIIAKPDPIAEAWIEATGNTVGMEPLNAALAARGLKIVEDK